MKVESPRMLAAKAFTSQAPPGMRQVLKGHRIVRAQWVEKTNKESGAPDIGVKAEWEPITEKR
jgi:hypothetical protein